MASDITDTPDLLTSCGLRPSPDPSRRGSLHPHMTDIRRPSTVGTWDQWTEVVQTLMDDLQTNRDDVMVESLRMIEKCLIMTAVTAKEVISLGGSIKRIRDAMMRCHKDAEVQQIGCRLLYRLLEHGTIIRQTLLTSAAHIQIVDILSEHHDNEETVYEALNMMCNLADDPKIQKQVLYSEPGSAVISCIVGAMDLFPENKDLQTRACRTIKILLRGQVPLQQEMVESHEYTAIINALWRHCDDHALVAQAMQVLQLLVDSGVSLEPFLGSQKLVLKCVAKYHGSDVITVAAFACLERLTISMKVCQDIVAYEPDLVPQFLSTLVRFPENAAMQAYGFSLFTNIAPVFFHQRSDHEETYWLQQLSAVMTRHREDDHVQMMCCRALVKLLKEHPELFRMIGDNQEHCDNEVPLHITCFGALLVHYKKCEVYEAACDAIYTLVDGSLTLRGLLMMRNAYIVVLLGMRAHRNYAGAQEAGCRTLRGLCKFSLDDKEKVAWADALVEALRALRHFRETVAVQIEAIGLIACLTDTEVVRTACIEDKVYRKILAAAEHHRAMALLQEVMLEALAILCGTDSGCEALIEDDVMVRVIEAMELHENEPDLQRKGLVVLQLLGSACFKDAHPALLRDLAQIVATAMQKHPQDKALREEGCVAMQILSEGSELFSQLLIDFQAHESLFDILETEPNTHLQEIASECLYVLCCIRDLKTQMLCFASARGMGKSVECLVQLGADVNVGAGVDTPLCNACMRNDEHLVAFLLDQGAGDLEMALQVSLQSSSPTIVGLLLKQWGYDRQNFSLSLNNLSLGTIHPEWLYPSILGRSLPVKSSEQGRFLATRVRSTQDRRSRRLRFAHGDPEAGIPPLLSQRRLSLRYPVTTSISSEHLQAYVQRQAAMAPAWDTADTGSDCETTQDFKPQGLGKLKRMLFGVGSRRNSREILPNLPKRKSKLKQKAIAEGASDRRTSVSSVSRNMSTVLMKSYTDAIQKADAEDTTSFILPNDGLHDWERVTFSGSNVPYSPLDPRQTFENPTALQHDATKTGDWYAKSGSVFSASTSMESQHSYGAEKKPTEELMCASPRLIQSMSDTKAGRASTPNSATFRQRYYRPSSVDRLERPNSTPPIALIDPVKKKKKLSVPDKEAGVPPCIVEDSSSDSPATPRRSTDEEFGLGIHRRHSRMRRSNTLSSIPAAEARGKHVTELTLAGNQLTTLDPLRTANTLVLLRFQFLEKLDISNNNLQSFPEDLFQHLHNLVNLNLSHNHLRRAPAKALTSQKLAVLDISNNQIGGLDDIAYYLSVSMREFYVGHNELKKVPLRLDKTMPNLELFSLAGNKIKDLPADPFKLTKLRRLDLSFNYIRVVPDGFLSALGSLATLEMCGNDLFWDIEGPDVFIDCLPSEEVAAGLERLTTVKMTDNRIGGKEPFYVPKFLLALPNLRFLDLSNNELQGLPEPELWATKTIREIRVSNNHIKKLNLNNAKLWSNIEGLYVNHNEITELPKEIGLLTGLQRLDFSYNDLTTIPDDLGNLERLYEMPLTGLHLDLDPALVPGCGGRTVKDLIRFLQEKLKKCIEYYHMKMMVLGFSGKGKSTLLRALTRKRQPNQSLSTVGIDVKDWKSSHWRKNRLVAYTLTTWDFAGQEEFYSTHNCFMSRRALYLIVYNVAGGHKEIESLKPWLVCIQAQAPKCPVIVVGTHLDRVHKDRRKDVARHMQESIRSLCRSPGFSHIRIQGMLELDCSRETTGVDNLRGLIKEVLDSYTVNKQPVMGMKIPASYVVLQELLTEECRSRSNMPIINHRRLLKIVKDAKLDFEEEELQQAVRFLHDSGILLHYEDVTLKLKDLYFLNPGWLCRMMAQVVTVREINPFIGPDGILQKKAVPLLFTGRQTGGENSYTFPGNLIPQYLRILEKFEIALPQGDDHLLIPCRLPKEKPFFVLPKCSHGYIQRQYAMNFMPLGFWSRLITRLHVFVKTLVDDPDFNGEDTQVVYWREGFYVCYDRQNFVLLDSLEGMEEGLEVTIPKSRLGNKLLGQIVDHIDSLVDEWYPGLAEVGPSGDSILQKRIPCTKCPGLGCFPAHVFDFDTLLHEAEFNDSVLCPVHGQSVPLSDLAPDVVLGDLEDKFALIQEQFTFQMKPENLLGDGCFGRVYRARYKGQTVAVKVYIQIGDISPHKLLRQELTILRRLHHPSLLSLIAVGLHPWMLVLELAPLGSLGDLLQSTRSLSRALQHRIALQIADGLKHLHLHRIIYRDLKPDNVLVFNLSLQVLVNVKISDYGIARFAAPYGLALSEGTPGYQAPEVSRGEAYSYKADVYSFGVLLYEIVTRKHPYDDLTFRNEFDEAMRSGRPIDPITAKGAPPWPDLEVVLEHCLQIIPDERSDSAQVFDELNSAEILALRKVAAVAQGETIECMAVRACKNDLEIWMASGNKDCAQVAWISLASPEQQVKGSLFADSRILCMTSVAHNYVLVGTQSGKVWVYDAPKHRCSHALPVLSDAVLCMQNVVLSMGELDYVFVGLADGTLVKYNTQQIIKDKNAVARPIRMGNYREPVKCMAFHHPRMRMYVSAGANIVIVKLKPYIEIDRSFSTSESGQSGIISEMCLDGKVLCLAKRWAADIEFWHTRHHTILKRFKLREYMLKELLVTYDYENDGRVTSMALGHRNHVWVGTGSGHIIVLDASNLDIGPLVVMKRYTGCVRSLAFAMGFDNDQKVILTGGTGFMAQAKQTENKLPFGNYGCLAAWEADLPQRVKAFDDENRKRKEWGRARPRSSDFLKTL